MSELDAFIQRLNSLETNLTRRVIDLESKKPTDHSATIAAHYQDILKITNTLNSFTAVLKSHGDQIQSLDKRAGVYAEAIEDLWKKTLELKAGLDTALAQLEEQRVKLQNMKVVVNPFIFWRK